MQNHNPDVQSARRAYDEAQLAHEAATAELTVRRESLRAAEARRASDTAAYDEALAAAREQRDRVVDLVEQVRQAGAFLTLAEAGAKAIRQGSSAAAVTGASR
jgi:hypothetical protein